MSKIETTQLTQDLSICRILNGMWQVSGGHGQIDHDSAINQMLEYAENGFNTWDMADIYGPAESLYGNFRNELEKRKGNNELEKINNNVIKKINIEKAKFQIEKKGKNIKLEPTNLSEKIRLEFKESGPFYGIKKDGKN